MADTDRSRSRQIQELLELIRQYGPEDVADAIGKAASARAYGADYVANILRHSGRPGGHNRRFGFAIRRSTNLPPTRSHCSNTTPSFSNPERNPMTLSNRNCSS
jgi:hypothetical protein